MLSICIPIYNCDVRKLVKNLHAQSESFLIEFEILLIDDYSKDEYRLRNREIKSLPNIRYSELDKNIGRAAIRNKLAREAHYRYLIFMDCDAGVYHSDYIRRYAVCCSPHIVCCGGRVNLPQPPGKEYILRWKYSIAREEINAEERTLHPNDNFLTFNFLIDKEIFNTVRFDEEIKSYGHEDTLFGLELFKQNIEITHIDNPLLHVDLDTDDEFILKTEQGICNLIEIIKRIDTPEAFINSIKLLRTKQKLAKCGLLPFVRLIYRITRKRILKNLQSENPSLFWFDFYKLGYLCCLPVK